MRANRLALRLVVVIAAATALGQTAAQSFRIRGTIVNASSDQPLGHTYVAIGLPQNGAAQETVTAEDGSFDSENPRAGNYWLAAESKGFSRQAFDQHEGFSTAIAVRPNLASEDVIFRLCPDAVISGTVFDEVNEPGRSAQVTLFHTGMENGVQTQVPSQQMTDDLGRYWFDHLRPGAYFVVVSGQPWYAQRRRFEGNFMCEAQAAV
jgi:carboxypeptidase family protein